MVDLSGIIDDLYAGTLDETAWHRALVSIADFLRGPASYLFAFNPLTGQVIRATDHRGVPKVLDDCWAYCTCHEGRLPAFLELPVGHAATEATLLDMSQWRRTPLFNELLLPADSPHFMPVWLHKSTGKAVTLSFQDSRKRGAFEPSDVETLQQLAPHLARALTIRDRLQASRVRADTLAATLNRLHYGVVLLDLKGRILESNATADRLFSASSIMRRKPDRTLWLHGRAGVELSRWIQKGQAPLWSSGGTWRMPRPRGAALCVLAAPLQPPLETSRVGHDPRWIVLFFDPDASRALPASLIQIELQISEREAELCALLVSGCNLREAAARLKISVHTTRNHLKAIFRKTGVRSQVDLMRRLASSSAIFAFSLNPAPEPDANREADRRSA